MSAAPIPPRDRRTGRSPVAPDDQRATPRHDELAVLVSELGAENQVPHPALVPDTVDRRGPGQRLSYHYGSRPPVLLFPMKHAGQIDPELGIGHDVAEARRDLGHGHDRGRNARAPMSDGIGERADACLVDPEPYRRIGPALHAGAQCHTGPRRSADTLVGRTAVSRPTDSHGVDTLRTYRPCGGTASRL